MKLPFKITRPLCAFDTETTGTNVSTDRIVSIAVTKIFPDGSIEKREMILDPEMEIPAEASAVHGISNEQIAQLKAIGKAPTFKQIAKSLYGFMQGCDLMGFIIINFDIPLLSESFARCDYVWPEEDTLFLDAGTIYKKMEARTLTAAMQFYCNEDLSEAHNAGADVEASIKVLIAQAERYDELKGKTVEEIAEFSKLNKRVDLAGKLVYNDDNKIVFNFGKHYNKSVYEIFKSDTKYYEWLISDKADGFTSDSKRCFKKLYEKIHQPKLL